MERFDTLELNWPLTNSLGTILRFISLIIFCNKPSVVFFDQNKLFIQVGLWNTSFGTTKSVFLDEEVGAAAPKAALIKQRSRLPLPESENEGNNPKNRNHSWLQEMAENRKELETMSSDIRYRRYSVEEILKATDSFSDSLKIGEGGYGPVFKSALDHTLVAIKILRSDVAQGIKQFQKEVMLNLKSHFETIEGLISSLLFSGLFLVTKSFSGIIKIVHRRKYKLLNSIFFVGTN